MFEMEKWSGTWESNVYNYIISLCYGSIETYLPSNINDIKDDEFEICILIKYLSTYRYCQEEKHYFKINKLNFKNNKKLKLRKNYNDGYMEFLIHFNENIIHGKYSISDPIDNGTFELKLENNQNDDTPYTLYDHCHIM